MQTLRKKTSPLKYKNETTRFLGDGVSFKAKLIGILEVSEARGDRMCQEALSDLKMAIRAAGEHKQRITINIAIDGLRLRDEKTGDSLYHHPVHKISFIAQDMTDSRAFGYIFGSPDTGHRFFGIKTDKAASQVVIAMRDLFQVVFAIKKKEIELAKQHLDKGRYNASPLFSETLTSKEVNKAGSMESKNASSNEKSTGTAVADLVDLELELNSLQQGLNQMERITPSDPFGDSFTSFNQVKPILPPPPSSGRDRASRTSDSSSIFSPKTPHTVDSSRNDFTFSKSDDLSSGDWFTPSNSLFEEPTLLPETNKNDKQHEIVKQEIMAQFDVFTELDPLDLKNPPKKPLNELVVVQTAIGQPPPVQDRPKSVDPFGEDPFVTEDPFADMSKHDPFESDFSAEFKLKTTLADISKSPKLNRLAQLHDTPTIQGDSECAPEPPPRPAPSLMQIKPPPLPPKKQTNDLMTKPPPRPPHNEDAHYDHVECYETGTNAAVTSEISPPLPVPARKTKQTNSDEDYLTPIARPKRKQNPAVQAGNLNVDTLDITLSQLTLSGLNELAAKLDIPTNQLSNMTLVQLTSYLSNFIKTNGGNEVENAENVGGDFKPDFAANFNDFDAANQKESYDRYAVFRELMNEEIKQTKIDTEPEEIKEEQEKLAEDNNVNKNNDNEDKYAALREIVETELKSNETTKQNEINLENTDEAKSPVKYNLIEYTTVEKETITTPKSPKTSKSPVPSAITEIQNNARLTSGSLSDVISGSSPEIDASTSEVGPKNADAAAESWAIFDQEARREKLQQSAEEGVSPWSSDSKEYGNGSPPDWRRGDSGSDHWPKRRSRREQEGWWDTAAEPPAQYYGANRRSTTDSYDDEYYECYDRPRRRKYVHASQTTGGHSSSSRDVSPWEEEPRRRPGWPRHPRQHSFEKHKDRRHADSWDEEDDDYEYAGRFHRHGARHGDWPPPEDYPKDRRHRRRREEGWCCPDYDPKEAYNKRYETPAPPGGAGMWRNKQYASRDSQESPSWGEEEEEEYNQSEEHFSKKNWKQRPSSASEMDRKTGEIKSRHFAPGGSDGERDRRYKPTRRSRSRDSQYSEPSQRQQHRAKSYQKATPISYEQEPEVSNKKAPALRKKKNSPKSEDPGTFPRRNTKKSLFENDFVKPDDFGEKAPSVNQKPKRSVEESNRQRALRVVKPKSLFEDDFSPGDKRGEVEETSISSIKEEIDVEEMEDDSFDADLMESTTKTRRAILNKRLSNCMMHSDLKKSDSVNIFTRDCDPFDDDFFSSENAEMSRISPRTTDLKWTDDFEEYGNNKK